MLVITRKRMEVVWVGDIKITIIDCGSHQVKIGFEAPDDVKIAREELLMKNDVRHTYYKDRRRL